MKKTVSLILALMFVLLMAVSCGKVAGRYDNYNPDKYLTLPEYKNLPVTAETRTVTDEMVKNQVDSSLAYYSEKVDVTGRPAKLGDIVTVAYAGYVETIDTEAKTFSNVELTLGFYEFPQEFEDTIVGMEIGEQRPVDVTFPEEFEDYPDYAGKTAHIVIGLQKITELHAPNYTDDFVRAYLKHDSIADYEASIREAIEKSYEDAFYSVSSAKLWPEIVEGTEIIQYPEADVKFYYDKLVDSVNNYVTTCNIDFDKFVEANFDMTAEEFYEYAQTNAEKTVKEQMIVTAIAKKEGISISEEEYKTLGEDYAVNYAEVESLAALEEKFSREEISDVLLSDKVKKAIVDFADVTYVDPEN